MEIKDVLDLVKAGFTKEEILKLNEVQSQAAHVPEAKPEPAPEPTETAPVSAEQTTEAIAKLNETVDALSEKIRQMNLLSAVFPESAVKQESAADVIGRIINPYTKKEV